MFWFEAIYVKTKVFNIEVLAQPAEAIYRSTCTFIKVTFFQKMYLDKKKKAAAKL